MCTSGDIIPLTHHAGSDYNLIANHIQTLLVLVNKRRSYTTPHHIHTVSVSEQKAIASPWPSLGSPKSGGKHQHKANTWRGNSAAAVGSEARKSSSAPQITSLTLSTSPQLTSVTLSTSPQLTSVALSTSPQLTSVTIAVPIPVALVTVSAVSQLVLTTFSLHCGTGHCDSGQSTGTYYLLWRLSCPHRVGVALTSRVRPSETFFRA